MTRPPDPRLTWRPFHDPRSRRHPARELIAQARSIPHKRSWKPGPRVLDQGREGACVGYAWAHELAASPHRVRGADDVFARRIYRRAQTEFDEWEGQNYTGTSVLAGAKTCHAEGYIGSYRWSFTLDDLVDSVLALGPAVVGIPWHSSAYRPRPSGLIDLNGDVVGGHAILVTGYHPTMRIRGEGWLARHEVFTLLNSWGAGWGRNGRGYIRADDLWQLLTADGEACIPLTRHTEGNPA